MNMAFLCVQQLLVIALFQKQISNHWLFKQREKLSRKSPTAYLTYRLFF
jgi:hypothetical protein